MRILILSFYFRPDLSAGSFRTSALVDELCERAPAGSRVDVITTLPNRYHSFDARAPSAERENNLAILRIAVPRHQSGLIDQSRAFLKYYRAALKTLADRDYDLVFATSSRLMTAVLGAHIARAKGAKLYLDIRDIFADTIGDVLPRQVSWLARIGFRALEKWTMARADKVNLISPGFAGYFRERYPTRQFSFFTNGIDEEFLKDMPSRPFAAKVNADKHVLTVVYAGNVGEGQGLHLIIPDLAKAMGSRIRFKIIGDGGRKRALESALSNGRVSNVELLPAVARNRLLEEYRAADVLFLHLNDYAAFEKVLPSKVFELAALGKPLWAGAAGYCARFIRAEISNAAIFHPCDVQDAMRSFDELTLRDTPRTAFVAKYRRSNITERMAGDILDLGSGTLCASNESQRSERRTERHAKV